MSKDQKEIAKLLAKLRKAQPPIDLRLKKIYNPYETIDLWVEQCNIEVGTNAVKAFVLHQNYKNWCIANSYEDEKIAKCKTFNAVMKPVLGHRINQRNLTFYLNKKVKYDAPKAQEGQKGGQRAKQKAGQEEAREALGTGNKDL